MRLNYSKIEDALAKSMEKLALDRFIRETDEAAGIKQVTPEEQHSSRNFVKALAHDLNFLAKRDPKFYEKIGVKKDVLKKLLLRPSKIAAADWEKVLKVKQRVDAYKADQAKKSQINDEKILADQAKEAENLRFNVNKKWIPLD